VKVNAVATSGVIGEIDAFLALAAENPVHVRFIERMPIGAGCRVAQDEAPLMAAEVEALLTERAEALGLGQLLPATDAEKPAGWGPAHYYRVPGALGSVGVIAPISRHFCATCSRLRLTADGALRPCLFSDREISLADALAEPGDDALRAAVRAAIELRPEGHGFLSAETAAGATADEATGDVAGARADSSAAATDDSADGDSATHPASRTRRRAMHQIGG